MLELSLGNVWAWALQVAAVAGAGVLLPSLLRMTSPGARLLHFRVLLLVCLALPLLQPWVPAAAPVVSPVGPFTGGLRLWEARRSSRPRRPDSGAVDRTRGSGPLRTPPLAVRGCRRRHLRGGRGGEVRLAGPGALSLARLRRTAVPLDPRPDSVDAAAPTRRS